MKWEILGCCIISIVFLDKIKINIIFWKRIYFITNILAIIIYDILTFNRQFINSKMDLHEVEPLEYLWSSNICRCATHLRGYVYAKWIEQQMSVNFKSICNLMETMSGRKILF